jgi:hypothetical protein
MKMEWKNTGHVEIKLDTAGEGTFEAIFAKMNVIDHDGDVTLPGAFGEQKVMVSQYNHGSWEKGVKALPIGVGIISERGDNGIVHGEFDMGDEDAVKTYKKFKYLAAKGRTVEFSYALPEIKSHRGQFNGQDVRFIEKVRVPEVSPVLMGAGIATQLLSVKGKQETMPIAEHIETVQVAVKELIDRIKSLGELRAADGRHPSEATMKSAAKAKTELTELIRELEGVQEKHDLAFLEAARFEKIIAERRK